MGSTDGSPDTPPCCILHRRLEQVLVDPTLKTRLVQLVPTAVCSAVRLDGNRSSSTSRDPMA